MSLYLPGYNEAVRLRLLAALFLLITFPIAACAGETIIVSAAVSLKETLSTASPIVQSVTGDPPQFNFGATGHLLAQIREGAPADVFVAASVEQMDQAEAQKLIDPPTRTVIASNEMVLIVPATGAKLTIVSFEGLGKPGVRRVAIGQPRTVPAGVYATQLLDHLKLTHAVADRIVYGSSVRQVLDYVARGEVDAGVVYATDAAEAGNTVRVVATAPPESHEPIRYVAAVVSSSKKQPAAHRFIRFLRSEAGQRILRDRGFIPPSASSPSSPPSTQPTTARAN
jgi:molybdate transport system substrate-binding protein